MNVKTLTAACLLCFALATPAHAADERVTLNFVNSELEATLKAVTIITGKSFVIDPKLKGTVNIVSSQPVDRKLVLPIVQSALRQQGISLVDNGTVIKVVAESEARQHGGPVILGMGSAGSTDKFVTQIYPLRYESASQLAQVLRPLLGNNSIIAAYQAGNVLVISDYAENLSRINRLIEHIDQAPDNAVQAFPVKNASVLDVAQNIARLMPEVVLQGTAASLPVPDGVKRVIVITDSRNGQLLVRSESAIHLAQIKRIVEMLDQPGVSGSSMHVVYLRNAEANRLAGTLRGILTGQDSGGSITSSLSGSGSSVAGSAQASLTAASATTQGGATSSGNTATNVKIDGATVMIQADSVTNSLIVTAPDHIYDDIHAIIQKLDVRRAQVYVEAMIAEVNVSKAGEFGIQWAVAGSAASGLTGGVISSLANGGNSIASISNALLAKTGSVPEGFNVGVFNGDPTKGTASLGALASAIERSGDGNVLSTPNLQTMDNEEARIVVGQNIPIVTGTQAATGSNPNPFTTVERRDIGIKLKIRPQISEGGAITLTVAQEVSSIDSSVNTGGTGIATKVRTIETKVLVDDGQIIVLGGLIEDRQTSNESRVPLLSSLPLIGHLFRYQSRSQQKVNLMVFLRPMILRDGNASSNLANERYDYLRARQNEFTLSRHLMLPDMPAAQLPPLEFTLSRHLTPPSAPTAGQTATEANTTSESPAKP
jgi:general secretion pathway protein D